tara:strand:- start:262 stop:669 length:408 start_codon:yes stop_codon:yes gene_type:complete
MKAIIYIPIKDAVKGTVQAASEWYTTTDQLSNNEKKSLVQVLVDSDQLQNMVDGRGWMYKDTEQNGERIFERNPDTGIIRSRKPGDYGNEEILSMPQIADMSMRPSKKDEQWFVDQYNRNRMPEDRVNSIDQIIK